MYTEECIHISYAIGFHDAYGFIIFLKSVSYMYTNIPVLGLHHTGNCPRL